MTTTKPMARPAWLGLSLAFLAAGLAFYGITPYARALTFPFRPLSGSDAALIYGGTLVVPVILGIVAALCGRLTMSRADRSRGELGGYGPAVFAILIGLFAATLAGVSCFVVFAYPRL